jgi:hypothetical protein
LNEEKPWKSGQAPRTWRTRNDPFNANWAEVEAHLKDAPELQAKSLFEWFQEQHPGIYGEGQLRSFQRRVRQWRALNGCGKDVYFPQVHHPGQRMQTDFTCLNEIGITIHGQAFDLWACHMVLPYSNWEWAVLCQSENYAALRQGVQTALWKLGHVPAEHWTDHTPVVTHWIGTPEPGRWEYNQDYMQLMKHFGLEPHMIQVASPNENGDVEAGNGALKNRLRQHLILRGSRDFRDREQWRQFMETVLDKANRARQVRLDEEFRVMKTLAVDLLPEYVVEEPRVNARSVIQVQRTPYSVPSRLIGEKVRVHRHEDRLEVYYAGEHQLTIPRASGRGRPQIDYRHVIDGLVRKPGRFKTIAIRRPCFRRWRSVRPMTACGKYAANAWRFVNISGFCRWLPGMGRRGGCFRGGSRQRNCAASGVHSGIYSQSRGNASGVEFANGGSGLLRRVIGKKRGAP